MVPNRLVLAISHITFACSLPCCESHYAAAAAV